MTETPEPGQQQAATDGTAVSEADQLAASPVVDPLAVAPAMPAILADLDAWFAAHIPNSAIARNTPLANQITARVAEIKSLIQSNLGE